MPEGKSQLSSTAGVNLTKTLIAQRNLSIPVEKMTPESISQALASLLILRLDRERISCIANLQGLEQIHSIYLQQNQIEKIENLSCLPNLKFLSLAGNRIHRVENLLALLKLQLLDLSQNCIETLDKECVLAALPNLIELDAQGVPSREAPVPDMEDEEDSEDSDYDDLPELSHPPSTGKDVFVELYSELANRSARRRREAASEHKARLEELKERWNQSRLLFEISQGSPHALSKSEPTTPTQEDAMLQTEHHTAANPLLTKTNPTAYAGPSTPKGKAEGGSRKKEKYPVHIKVEARE